MVALDTFLLVSVAIQNRLPTSHRTALVQLAGHNSGVRSEWGALAEE